MKPFFVKKARLEAFYNEMYEGMPFSELSESQLKAVGVRFMFALIGGHYITNKELRDRISRRYMRPNTDLNLKLNKLWNQ